MNGNVTVIELSINEISREVKIKLPHEEFTVALGDFNTLSVSQGCVVDELTYDSLVFMDASLRCMKKAMLLLSYSAKNERTLKIKLSGAFEEEVVCHVLEALKEKGLINDRKLAHRYAERCARQKLWGPLRIKNELLTHGFSHSDTLDAVDSLDDECCIDCALTLLRRKFSTSNLCDPEVRRMMKAFLMKYGYTGDLIYRIMEKID